MVEGLYLLRDFLVRMLQHPEAEKGITVLQRHTLDTESN
jgi:hypothetical protein